MLWGAVIQWPESPLSSSALKMMQSELIHQTFLDLCLQRPKENSVLTHLQVPRTMPNSTSVLFMGGWVSPFPHLKQGRQDCECCMDGIWTSWIHGASQHGGKCCWSKTEGRSSTGVQTPDSSRIPPAPSNPFCLPMRPPATDSECSVHCWMSDSSWRSSVLILFKMFNRNFIFTL